MSSSALLRPLLVGCLFCAHAWAGYTHYFTWRQKPDEAALRECMREMRLLVEARRPMLAGTEGMGPPIMALASLEFNGFGEDANEPFVFPGTIHREISAPQMPAGFNFCKTDYKQYDEVVTACLMVARDHFPPSVLAIKSDGTWENDWRPGARLYSSVFNRPAVNPIAGKVTDENWAMDLSGEVLLYGGIGAFLLFVIFRKKASLLR